MTRDDDKRYLILKDPNIKRGLFMLALPIMLNNFIKTIHDVVDIIFVSRVIEDSATGVGAISATFPVIFMFIALGIGVSIAGTALISQLVGSNQIAQARKYATNLIYISVIAGGLFLLLAFFGAPFVMKAMGAEGFLLEKSITYLRIRAFELPLLFTFFAFQSIRQSTGDTVTPVIFGIITVVLNIILSPILIMVLGLGVEGAAIATLISQVAIVPFVVYQLFRSKSGLTIDIKEHKLQKAITTPIIKTALPASFGQAFTAIGFIVLTSIIIHQFSFVYGIDPVTGEELVNNDVYGAFSVGNRISSLALHPVMAIGGVLGAYIGQNIGNLNKERAKKSFREALVLSIVIMSVLSLILLPLRGTITTIFYERGTEVYNLTVRYMFFLLVGLPLMGIFQSFLGAFNGSGKTNYTFIVSVTRLWGLRVPLILLFVYVFNSGPSGIWTAMLISNFIIAFIGYFFYQKLTFEPKVELDI